MRGIIYLISLPGLWLISGFASRVLFWIWLSVWLNKKLCFLLLLSQVGLVSLGEPQAWSEDTPDSPFQQDTFRGFRNWRVFPEDLWRSRLSFRVLPTAEPGKRVLSAGMGFSPKEASTERHFSANTAILCKQLKSNSVIFHLQYIAQSLVQSDAWGCE